MPATCCWMLAWRESSRRSTSPERQSTLPSKRASTTWRFVRMAEIESRPRCPRSTSEIVLGTRRRWTRGPIVEIPADASELGGSRPLVGHPRGHRLSLRSSVAYRGRGSRYHRGMYLDAMEFLEEEREAWRPFEDLSELARAELERPWQGPH